MRLRQFDNRLGVQVPGACMSFECSRNSSEGKVGLDMLDRLMPSTGQNMLDSSSGRRQV